MKKDFLVKFNTITNILIILLLVTGGFVWADTNGIWLRSEDVRPGVFGGDEISGDFIFEDKLLANNEFCLDGECHLTWSSVCQSWLESNAIN